MQRGKCRKSGWGLQDEPLLAWRAWPGATLLALLQPRSWRVRAGRRAGRKALHRWGKCGLQTAHPKPAARASPAECPAGGSGLAGAPGRQGRGGLAGAPGRPGAAHSGGRLGAPPHGRGAGTTHLAEEGGPRGPPRPHADLALPAPLCASARPRRSARKRLFFLCIYFFFLLTTMKGLLKSLWEKCTEEVLSLFHGYFKAPGLLAHALRLS